MTLASWTFVKRRKECYPSWCSNSQSLDWQPTVLCWRHPFATLLSTILNIKNYPVKRYVINVLTIGLNYVQPVPYIQSITGSTGLCDITFNLHYWQWNNSLSQVVLDETEYHFDVLLFFNKSDNCGISNPNKPVFSVYVRKISTVIPYNVISHGYMQY